MSKKRDKKILEKQEKEKIREYFNFKGEGVFVEVGANEPVSIGSQSWHLEKHLNWSGLLIEPNPELAEQARKTRPQSVVCQSACTSPEKSGEMILYIPIHDGQAVSGHAAVGKNVDDFTYRDHVEIKVHAKTLNDLLEENNICHIDFLSVDVEGTEMDVLLGIDLKKYRPKLILLEDKHVYLTKHRYITKQDYVLVKKTKQNFWYIPKGQKRPDQTLLEKLRIFKRLYISIWWKKIRLAVRSKTLAPLLRL